MNFYNNLTSEWELTKVGSQATKDFFDRLLNGMADEFLKSSIDFDESESIHELISRNLGYGFKGFYAQSTDYRV